MNIPLLSQLRQAAGEFLTMEALGGDVAADLDELEAFGFAIERHPYLGAAYRGPAARLCPDQIEHRLETHLIGRRIAVWNRVASTNDLAAQASSVAANDGLVVLAEEQTSGRGRRGRRWSAPAGSSILMSLVLFPRGPLAEPPWLTALGAVAVAEVVSAWTGRLAAIKWPNDVRVDGRKIAGILVERGAGGVVIGIGLNANLPHDGFPEDLRPAATSLQILLGTTVDRSEVARALIQRLDDHYSRCLRDGPAALNAPWRDRSEHLGQSVTIALGSGPLHGRLTAIDLIDGLRLTVADGSSIQIAPGQVLSVVNNPDPDAGPTAPDTSSR